MNFRIILTLLERFRNADVMRFWCKDCFIFVTLAAGISIACQPIPKPDDFRPYKEIPIMPADDGYIDGKSNEAGIQGHWYSYAGLDSHIVPEPLTKFELKERKICTQGTTAIVVDGQFSTYYGAGIGFYLCFSGDTDSPPEFPYTLSECPISSLSPNMHTKIAGIAFDIEANQPQKPFPEVRVIFREWRREESPYVSITETGARQALFRDANFLYPAADRSPSHTSEIHSILFQVAGLESGSLEFDFCISNLRVLINPTVEADTSSYESTDNDSLDAGDLCNSTEDQDTELDWILISKNKSSFEMLRTEVTAAQYQRCKDAGCCTQTGNWDVCSVDNAKKSLRAEEPANCVTWYQARAFCTWAGGRLPTEEEWTVAAYDKIQSDYPWGNEEPVCKLTVMNAEDPCRLLVSSPANVCSTTPFGNTSDGLCDMSGNVWEWIEDWYPKSENIPEKTFRIMKGGSYFSRREALKIDSKSMEHPSVPRDLGKIGFRCVR